MDYHNKYIKYKQKYLKLKNQQGGKLPFVPDYFPFANKNFNYYNDDGYTLIINDSSKEDYSLNKRFELVKLDSKFDKTVYNKKNIINNDNIYKLADEQITISDEIKIPFHLCLLSQPQYKILDKIYKIHIKDDIKNNIIFDRDIQKIFKLKKDLIDTFLKDNAKDVITNIYNFHRERIDEILNISYNYNILLKYSCCNKFLELLQLIYDIQTKIQSKIELNISELYISSSSKYKQNIKILFEIDDKFNLEEYIIINIINIFISSDSNLKDNFDKIFYFYNKEKREEERQREQKKQEKKEQQKEQKEQIQEQKELIIQIIQTIQTPEQKELESKLLKDYENAIQTYINISDTNLLFKDIRNNKGNKELILKDKDLKKDYESLKEHLNIDIVDINQLLLFNLYVDNKIDISPKFSYIFYATFIYYRINKPLISYPLFDNLYPINKNNFVCNLLNIDNTQLSELSKNNTLSDIKLMFNSNYIRHPIHSDFGIVISIETNNYTNCVENAILEFIKILFWDQKEKNFKIRLPEENIKLMTKPLQLLNEIFKDINSNLTNLQLLYDKEEYHNKIHELLYDKKEYHKKIHELFIGHNNIVYGYENRYEIISTIDNVLKILCIILNFKDEEKLKEYFLNISKYNSDITQIDIYIENHKLYAIQILKGHTQLKSFNNININKLIKYDYFNLLIYYTDIISKINSDECFEYIQNFYSIASKNPVNLKYYEYIVILIIIKTPKLTGFINDYYNRIEIILSAIEKNPNILCYILSKDIKIICNKILSKLDEKNINYKNIIKCIVSLILDNNEIEDNEIEDNEIVNILIKNHYDIIYKLVYSPKIYNNKNYKKLVICILRYCPKFFKDFSEKKNDHDDFIEIALGSIKINDEINYEIVEYLVINHYDHIIKFLKKKSKYDNYNNLVIYILSFRPDLIYHIDHDDFLKIVSISIKINYKLIDYLLENHYDLLNILLNKIKSPELYEKLDEYKKQFDYLKQSENIYDNNTKYTDKIENIYDYNTNYTDKNYSMYTDYIKII